MSADPTKGHFADISQSYGHSFLRIVPFAPKFSVTICRSDVRKASKRFSLSENQKSSIHSFSAASPRFIMRLTRLRFYYRASFLPHGCSVFLHKILYGDVSVQKPVILTVVKPHFKVYPRSFLYIAVNFPEPCA